MQKDSKAASVHGFRACLIVVPVAITEIQDFAIFENLTNAGTACNNDATGNDRN